MAHQAQLLDSIIGTKFEPQFDCPSPATKCSWDTFTSLAVCGTFSNMTDTATRNCTSLESLSTQNIQKSLPTYHVEKFLNRTCSFTAPGMDPKPLVMSWHTTRVNISGEGTGIWNCGYYDIFDTKVEGAAPGWQNHDLGLYAKFLIVRTLDNGALYDITDARDYTSAMWHLTPPTELLQASWSFCEHVYSNVSVDLGLLHVGGVTTNTLNLVGSPELNLRDDYVLHSNATGINYTVGSQKGEWSAMSLSELFSTHLGGIPLPSHETRPTYNRSDSSNIHCSSGEDRIDFTNGTYFAPSEVMKSLTHYLRSADVRALTDDIAEALTARIRNSNMRGNTNLTMLAGDAFIDEAFITVQWPWMILPVMETVLAAAALAVTIVLTRQQALLKGSMLSLLMQRMDGWSSEDMNVRRLDSKERLRHRVKEMVARLDEGQDGELIFKRSCRQ